MRIELVLFATFILFIIFFQSVYADIPPGPDEHLLNRCVKIINLNEFPDIVLVAQDLFIGDKSVEQTYIVDSTKCLNITYKFNLLKIYAVDKEYFTNMGINNINYSSDNNSLVSNPSILLYYLYLPNTNPLIYEYIDYLIAGFSGDNLIIYVSRNMSVYNDGTPNKTLTFEMPYIPDLRLTLHEPEPLNPVPAYWGYIIENNQCVFREQNTPLPTPNYANLTECESHLQVCTAQYNPVCGVDNNTYSNSCFADSANVSVNCTGVCPCQNRPMPDGNILVAFFNAIICFFKQLFGGVC